MFSHFKQIKFCEQFMAPSRLGARVQRLGMGTNVNVAF